MEAKLAKLTIADKKQAKPASEFVSKSNGLAAAYALTIKPGATAYRYDVEITRQHPKDPAKNRSLTKRAPDDGEASLRKILCAEVVTAFKNKTNNFGLGPKGQFVCYDGTKNLYLPQPMALQAGKKSMEFTAADLSPFGKNQILDCSVLVEISQSQQHEINFSDVASMMDTREGPADRSAAQFLDLLTSQYAVSSLEYISLGLGKLYQRRGEVMQNKTMELRSGLSKGIQLVDNNGKTNVALMIDAKKTAFYRSDFLHVIFKDANVLGNNFQQSHSVMSQLYNGVRCSLKHAQSRTVVITKISTELAKNIKVDQHGSMPEYFKKKYNVVIDPSLPVIETEKAPFPMDLLIVCPNQRVPMEKLDDNVRRTILMGTAVPPEDRFKRIREEIEQAKLVPSNNIMEFFGVKIAVPKMLEATIQVRASPGVMIQKNGKSEVLASKNAAWKMTGVNLFSPTQFLVAGFPVLYPRGFEPKQFVEGLLVTASKLGLKIGAPTYQQVDLSNYKAMQKKFAELGAAKTRFVLVFDFQRNKSHHDLKLLEREYSVLTMQIKIETTKRQGLGQTYENLVLKMNAKASGVNFIPMIEKCGGELSLQRKVLVIGLDIGLPARGSPKELYELRKKDLADVSSHEPAVVGVCGNWGKQPATILGDYYYQPATHETLDPELLKQNFSRVLDRFMKSRNAWPEHIVVFRDGVGNGQLHQTTQAEYPVLVNVCKQFKGDNPMPNIIYIIVTKKHNKRFVNGAAGKESNPVPNSVIDRGVVRPDLCEFYMQSHRPLKGTAKIPHYCVMMNPKNMSMDALQAFCNHLCLNHQVVTSAVSLPEPIYHAKEQTKRGRNNLNAKRLANDNQVPRAANGLVDCQKVTQALGYANVALGQIKFAA